jgi:hypothetical protein
VIHVLQWVSGIPKVEMCFITDECVAAEWSRFLLEKLIFAEMVKKYSTFCAM